MLVPYATMQTKANGVRERHNAALFTLERALSCVGHSDVLIIPGTSITGLKSDTRDLRNTTHITAVRLSHDLAFNVNANRRLSHSEALPLQQRNNARAQN